MDRKYITEHNLFEAHKQFMRLSEGYLATSLREAGDDEENNNQAPDMAPGMDNGQDMGNPMPMDNQQPQQGMNDMPQDNMDMPQPDDMNMDMGNPMPEPEIEKPEDDTVLDVDDITNAQEKLNKKENEIGKDLGQVDDRIIKLLAAVEKIQGTIDKNNNDITALKAELEKRVPTEKEKLDMQSLRMYPYNISPNDYWKEKEKEGIYDAQEGDDKQYDIREKDVDDYSDSEIEKSFDDEYNQTMKDIFRGF